MHELKGACRGAAAAARTSLTKGCLGGVVFQEGERYVRARVWAWRVGQRFVCVRYMTMQGRGRFCC